MDVDFEMVAARNGKKFQEMSSLQNQERLNEIFVALINYWQLQKKIQALS